MLCTQAFILLSLQSDKQQLSSHLSPSVNIFNPTVACLLPVESKKRRNKYTLQQGKKGLSTTKLVVLDPTSFHGK